MPLQFKFLILIGSCAIVAWLTNAVDNRLVLGVTLVLLAVVLLVPKVLTVLLNRPEQRKAAAALAKHAASHPELYQ